MLINGLFGTLAVVCLIRILQTGKVNHADTRHEHQNVVRVNAWALLFISGIVGALAHCRAGQGVEIVSASGLALLLLPHTHQISNR